MARSVMLPRPAIDDDSTDTNNSDHPPRCKRKPRSSRKRSRLLSLTGTATATATTPAWFGPSLCLEILLVVVAVSVVVWGPQTGCFVSADCPPHGCSLKPVDVLLDKSGIEALRILRKTFTWDTNDGSRSSSSSSSSSSSGSSSSSSSSGSSSSSSSGSNDEERADDENSHAEERRRALLALQGTGDDTKTTLTMQGYKGGPPEEQINQDRAILISPFLITDGSSPAAAAEGPYSSPSRKSPMTQILGIFDGHGDDGELTSQHAATEVPRLLANKLAALAAMDSTNNEEGIVMALKETFLEVDRTDPSEGNGGCTATVILQFGSKLFIANAGDSVSFIGVLILNGANDESNGQAKRPRPVEIVYQSREDKPDLPEEKERIQAAGGYVHIPRDDSDVPRAYYIDETGHAIYGLAMSRSLGDWSVQGVIAEPIVDVLDVGEIVRTALASHLETCQIDNGTEQEAREGEGGEDQFCNAVDPHDVHIFAVSASDGMMDYLEPDYVGSLLAEAFFDPNSQLHPHTAAEYLVRSAATAWERDNDGEYRDDIAVAAFVVMWDESMLSAAADSQ